MGRGRSQAQQRKEAEAAARLEHLLEEADTPRKEAREALRLDRAGRHDEAIARADELAAKHPESAVVAHLAAILHYDATTRAIDAKDRQGIEKHCNTARDFYIQAKRLAPNCVEIAICLATARLRCHNDGEAEPEIHRALAIPVPTDPAENNVAYDLVGGKSTSKDRLEKVRKLALDRRHRIVSYVRNKTIPDDVRFVLNYARSEGVAKTVKPAKELAERYYYSARAHLTHAYIDLEFARGLAPGIDKRPFLSRILTQLNNVANQFETSLVLAMFRAKLSFLLGMYIAMTAECFRAISMEGPADPWDDDVPPGSVPGEKSEDRVYSICKELERLQKKLAVVAIDYWQSLTSEKRDIVLSVGLNSMHQYYVKVYEEYHEGAKTISDALSFVKKNGSWRYWICPYCVGKKIPDTDALLQHMRNKHPEGSVWPKLLSVLDPKLIPDTSRGDHFSDDVTVYQDSEEHYVFHFKRIPTSSITEQRPFSEMRENKCTEGIEILEKIKLKLKNVPADILSTELNEACAEIRDLWHYFLEISVLDFRVVLLPLVISFIWERFLLCMMEDKKAASESVDAADIDAVFPYVDDTPDIDEIFANVDGALESNDAICPVPGASDSSAANIDAIRPNVVDASNSNAANTDAVCHSTADAPDSNAADIDAVCPNVGDAPENNAADTYAIIPNIADAPENNAADTDAIIPNIADSPDRNSATKDGSDLSHANKVQKDEVNQKPENIMLSYSDDTATDGGDKESEVHVKDENYGATVNEKESSPPTEMVEYGSELDATPGNMEADLKYDSPKQTSLPSLSDQIYSTAKTASHLLGKFDQSTEEIASISCYRNSIDVLKKNNADEDLYFLNVIIQLLWNLRHFRNEFLRRRSAFDIAHEDLCIAEKLYKIFSAWEKNEHSKMVLLLTDVKTTLCGIVNDSNMFQTLQVGRNFASEIMAIILQGLHKFDNSMYVGSMRMVIDAPCKYCVWYTLGLFGIRLKQLMSCRCGEWFGEECILFFHKLDASSPHSTKINCFEELSVLMNSQSNCERRCTNCSGSVKQIGCFLSKGPHFFTIVLKDWLGSNESQAILSEALFGIASPLDITLLYKGVTLRHIGGHSATKYRLASVICYIEHGYVCFARDQDKWLKYDTTTVKTVDSWGELLELYREINLQPEVLVYEVIK